MPDFITDAVLQALDAASAFKSIPYFGETDFDMDGLASLLFVSRMYSLNDTPEGLAIHLAAVMNNPNCPTSLYNAIGDELCSIGSGPLPGSPVEIALHLRADAAREAGKVT